MPCALMAATSGQLMPFAWSPQAASWPTAMAPANHFRVTRRSIITRAEVFASDISGSSYSSPLRRRAAMFSDERMARAMIVSVGFLWALETKTEPSVM